MNDLYERISVAHDVVLRDCRAEIAALREAIRAAHRVLSGWTLDDDDDDVRQWKGIPAVRRALEEGR